MSDDLNRQEQTYSVLQTEVVIPTEAQLVAAFRCIEALTDYDAKRRARSTAGYIAEKLTHGQAMGLLGGMAQQGIAAAVQADNEIPSLAQPFNTRLADCTPAGLELLDAMNRSVLVPWDSVRLVACGEIMTTKIKKRRMYLRNQIENNVDGLLDGFRKATDCDTVRKHSRPQGTIGNWTSTYSALLPSRTRHTSRAEWRLEFHTLSSPFRWVLRGQNQLLVNGEHVAEEAFFVSQCVQRATKALINFGVQNMVSSRKPLRYDHVRMFERELRWLTWIAALDR